MEKSLERRLERDIRSPEEVALITDLALELSGGDEARAERFIHRVLFEMHDRSWGVNLHEGDSDLPLVDAKMVCEYLRLATEGSRTGNLRKIAVRAAELAVKRPHEASLYRTMVHEVGEGGEVAVFEKIIFRAGIRLMPLDGEDIEIYQRIVGKSYWELDSDMLRRVFISNFIAWRTGMGYYDELDREFQPETSIFLTGLRINLRRIARVIVAKKALPERQATKFFKEEQDGDGDSTDVGIDMETARSFLD